MSKPFIPVILGTARAGRQSEKVARAIHYIIAQRSDMEAVFIDVQEYVHGKTIPPWEEHPITKPWRDIVSKANAFIIVTPEYNHGYPGELKMLLDQELKAYIDKPVVVCGVSKGRFGGTRVVENLLPVLRELGMIASWYSLYVGDVQEFPDNPEQAGEDFKKRVGKAADMLIKMLRR